MNEEPLIYEKQLRFFKINPPKKTDVKKTVDRKLSFLSAQNRKVHETIRQVIKDFQFYSNYQKQEMNLTEGQRVLKMNGIKIIKQNNTYFMEKYSIKEESILKKAPKVGEKTQGLRLQFIKSQCVTDPRYFLTQLGYTTKQANYFRYMEIQCYKFPGYGIEITIFQKWDQFQYMMIDSICNYEGFNVVSSMLIEKLLPYVSEEALFNIDPYTLRPKNLKHGQKPQF